MRDLSRLLRPSSVAVLGGIWAANVVRACAAMGYGGRISAVHPSRSEIAGVTTVPCLGDLPDPPDAVFLGVNRAATVDAVAELAVLGAGGAICFASDWAEAGQAAAQDALVRAAGEMPVLGPNCYGLLNYLDGAAIWPDQHGGTRVDTGVAIISQSSNIAISLTMQRRGLPVAYVACTGNAAQTGVADIARAMLADDRVTALGLYLEGVGDARALAEVAASARASGKGIVALKSGRSVAGASAAVTHTAALTGAEEASAAFLRQAGIGRVHTLPALVETLKILHLKGPLRGRRIAVACCSGGEAGLAADLADDAGLPCPPLGQTQVSRLQAALGPRVGLANPLDYQTHIWGDRATTATVFTALLDEADVGLFVIDPPRADRCDPESFLPALDAVGDAAARTGRPALAVSTLPESLGEANSARLIAAGAVPIAGLDTAMAAIDAAAAPPPLDGWRPVMPVSASPSISLDEAASKAVLRDAGLSVPPGVTAPDLASLFCGAAALSPPFALKGLGLAHKTEIGAVRLGVTRLDNQLPMPGVTGYLLEEMIGDSRAELILGVRRDPVYGATLTLGSGGIAAEVLRDTIALVCPVDAAEIAAALRHLRLWPLLDGHRGRPRPDIDAAIAASLHLQAMFLARTDLLEIEINPLILTGSDAIVADALVLERPP